MAKVMISMPDELLKQVDAVAASKGLTRSAAMREFAEAALEDRAAKLRAAMAALEIGKHAKPHGGNAVELLREAREERARKLTERR
jgi:metal-responsive CopG/Arc/MetJ family transcriptional regulator